MPVHPHARWMCLGRSMTPNVKVERPAATGDGKGKKPLAGGAARTAGWASLRCPRRSSPHGLELIWRYRGTPVSSEDELHISEYAALR